MSNLYYRYPPADGSASTIPPKSSDAPPASVSALPFASAAGQHPGSSGGTWDANSTTNSSLAQSQQFSFAQQQQLHQSALSGQHRLHSLPPQQTPSATQQQQRMLQQSHHTVPSHLNGRVGIAQMTSFPHAGDNLGERPGEATRGGPDRFGRSASHSLSAGAVRAPANARVASSVVFDPNEFPSLAGPAHSNSAVAAPTATAAAAAATASARMSSSAGTVGVAQTMAPPLPGLGVVGGGPGLGAGTTARSAGGHPQQSMMSSLGSSAPTSELAHPSLSDYSDLYNLSAYASRGKAVEALAGVAPASEFSMQSEDFPALGALGGKQPESIFGPHPTSHLTHPPDLPSMSRPQELQSVGMTLRREALNATLLLNGDLSGGSVGVALEPSQEQELRSSQTEQQEAESQVPGQAQCSSPMPQASQGASMAASAHSLFDTVVPSSPKVLPERASPSQAPQLPQGDKETLAESSHDEYALDDRKSNVPARELMSQSKLSSSGGMEPDYFGLKGLLRVLNPGSDATDLFLLSVGLDLTRLGLNLNSADPLHTTLETPWDAKPEPTAGSTGDSAQIGPKNEPDFTLPECYFMNPPPLKTSHFTKFQVETLFYVFYNMPRSMLQYLAAVELSNREWRYHKELKLWFTRVPGTAAGYERGAAYIYFDISSWERLPFHDANLKFIQGLMTEEELRAARPPAQSMGSS